MPNESRSIEVELGTGKSQSSWLEKAVVPETLIGIEGPIGFGYWSTFLDCLGCTVVLMHNLGLADLGIDYIGFGRPGLSIAVPDIGYHALHHYASVHHNPQCSEGIHV